MKNKIVVFLWLIFSIYSLANAQEPSTIKVVVKGTNEPAKGTMIILQPLNFKDGKKQEIYITDDNGEVLNVYHYPKSIIITSFGFQTIEDSINPDSSYVFYLTKLAIDLGEIVVTGQYDINTSDKSIYNVKVIDENTIRSMAAQDLSDLLSNQLNIRLSQDNILGSAATIDGISGQNVKILVDGVNIIGRENGNIDLSQINLNNVNRVEIIEGPMSVSYGTDAIGGIINIVTRKSSSYPFEANVNLYTESVGTYNGDGALLWRKNSNALSISGGRKFFDGYSPVDTSRFLEWKPREQYFGSINYNYTGDFHSASVKSEYFNQKIQNKGNPVLTPYQAYGFDDYYFTRRLNESLVYEWRMKKAKLQFINAYSNYRHIKNTFRKDLVTLDQTLLTGDEIQDTSTFYSFAFRGTYSTNIPLNKINYQLGYDVNFESGEGNKITTGFQQINDYALFGSVEFHPIPNILIRPGVRYSYNTRYGAPVTPSINIKYNFSENTSFRASYARGFRSPSLKELDLYFVDVNHNISGNNNLKAEHSDHYDLSFTGNHVMTSAKVKAQISLFYNDIDDIITLALVEPVTQLYTYINIDKYKSAGGTVEASYKTKNFSYSTGFSMLGSYNTLSDSLNVDKFSWTPELQNNLLITLKDPGMEGAVFFKSTGTTPAFSIDENGNSYQTFIEAFTMVDVSITKYLWKTHLALSMGVKNLFNVIDIQTNSLQASIHTSGGDSLPYSMGRFVFASLRVKLYSESNSESKQ
jgi:outer membrane receptor for ferrienterochelin and colicins